MEEAMRVILRLLVFGAIGCLATTSLAQDLVHPGTPETIKQLRASATKDRAQADEDQKRVGFLRDMAQKVRKLAELTSDQSYRVSWLEDAKRREAEANELEAASSKLRARAEEKDAHAARLEAAYNEKYGDKPAPSPPRRRDPAAQLASSPPAGWAVEDLIGLWTRSGEPGFTMAIVPQLPDEPAMINRIEAHSDRRIWLGTFQSESREGPARAVLTYTPKPEEMNPAMPDWARRVVSGKLVWRLELVPKGDVFNPTLEAKWYPGEVSWNESDRTSASVIGDGKPLEFAFEPVDAINIESLSHSMVAIKLPNPAHDPSTDPVEALIKGQRFFVRVTLPIEIAREKGTKISVTVRSLAGGGEEQIELTGAIGKGQRPVVYSHDDPVTIADCHALLEARRNPQPLSLTWIWNKVGQSLYGAIDAGACLNINLKNEDMVEVRYGDAAVQVPVYDSWVQRGIARHVEGAARLREVYQSLLVGPYNQATKEAAHTKLRMLANYEALRSSDKLTDLHRFFVGEAYLGDGPTPQLQKRNDSIVKQGSPSDGSSVANLEPAESAVETLVGIGGMPPALLQTENTALNNRYQHDRRNPPHKPTESTYFTPLIQATLEGLTGKDLTPKAWTAGNPIIWTSEAEQFYVLREIRAASTRLAEDAVKTAHENWSFGLYDGVASATSAGGLYLLVSGKDHFNRPQPRWARVMAAVSLSSNAVLHLYGPKAASRFVERIERRLPPIVGKVVQTGITALGKRGISRVDGRAELPGVPKSVQGRKREKLSLELSHDAPSTGSDIPCAPRSLSPRAPRSLSPTQGPLEDLMRDAVEQVEIHAYKNKNWGPETKILDLDGPPVTARQQWKNCQERAVNDGIHEATGVKIDQDHGVGMMERIAQAQKDAGLRSAASAKLEVRTVGFDNQTTRGYLRVHGAKVSDLAPKNNSQLNLRHIKVLLQNGWLVKAIVRFGPHDGKWGNHAVRVRKVVTDPKTGDIVSVQLYDSNVGRILDVPAKRFQELLREAAPNLEGQRQGILTIFRFDAD